MRGAVLTVAVAICVVACSSGGTKPQSTAEAAGTPATTTQLSPYFGSYSTSDQDTIVIARLGWYFDRRSSDYRTIYATSSPDKFTIGPAFEEATPRFAELEFAPGTLKIVTSSGARTARRIDLKQTDVSIPAAGAVLAGTITEPVGAGPHPGIVIIHGSEPGQRYFYDIWVGIYTSLGLAVLTYDKRGNGSSTGVYPGEYPTDESLATYADDAAAALDFLAHRPGIESKRVGFHGGSQGGWTVPLAMKRHPGVAAFAVLVSAPATTVDQTDTWKEFSGGGAYMPSESTDQMLAEVRARHSGYDPAPALQALNAPALWLLGSNDRTVPTAVCIEILAALHKTNFTVQQLPTGHGLLVNPTGLAADDARSPGLAPQLVPAITGWLEKVNSA